MTCLNPTIQYLIIQHLSKLSLEAIINNKQTFTSDEITAGCPDIVATPGAINGFDLLQVVQHFGLDTKAVALNFIHFTIQEFLAAHYISHLPPNEELKVIKEIFWSDMHFNMFCMYISLTKGQYPAFKKILSGGNELITISHKFLNPLQCVCLYCCFNEADDHAMCNTIEQAQTFHNTLYNFKHIDLSLTYVTLTVCDMECISLFLVSSSIKEWGELYLPNCYIQDKGLYILYHGLCHSSDFTINQLWLDHSGLTM